METVLRKKYANLSDFFDELHEASENVQERTLIEREESKNIKLLKIREVAELFGVSDTTIRNLSKEGKIPEGHFKSNNRRFYSLADLELIRAYFKKLNPDTYDPLRHFRQKGLCEVLAVANFKGGVAKTICSVHIAQYLALQGYRVCLVDLDNQGSATTMMGFVPNLDFQEEDTIVPFMLREDPSRRREQLDIAHDLAYCVHDSNWSENLKLIPANNYLSTIESTLPAMQMQMNSFYFWRQLKLGLDTIRSNFDVIVCDFPPNLGYLAMNGLYAANGLIVPLPPNMLDFASSSSFFENCSAIANTIERYEGKSLDLDFVKILPTRCPVVTDTLTNMADDVERREKRQSIKILNCMVDTFGEHISSALLLSSEAIREASKEFETVFERELWEASRQTVRRCLSSVNAVCHEIERDIFHSLKQRYEDLLKETATQNTTETETA